MEREEKREKKNNNGVMKKKKVASFEGKEGVEGGETMVGGIVSLDEEGGGGERGGEGGCDSSISKNIALVAGVEKGSLFLSWLTSSDHILRRVCELSSVHSPTIIDHLILLSRFMQCVRNDGSTPKRANQVVEGLFEVLTTTLNSSLDPVDLRGESLPIYLLKTFMIQFGTETRVAVIDPVTRRFYDCEDRLAGLSFGVISKEKVSQQDLKLLKRLLKELKFLVEEMVHRSRTFMLFPPPILFLCHQVYLSLVHFHTSTTDPPPSPKSEEEEKCHSAAIDDLSSFIFLRYVCPSLVNLYSSDKQAPPPSVSSLAARILMHITGQLQGGWTKSQSSKVKKEIDALIIETRPKLRLFGQAVIENAARFSNRNVQELIEEEILILPEDDTHNFLSGLERSLESLLTMMSESSGFQEFHSSLNSLSATFQNRSSSPEPLNNLDHLNETQLIQLKSRQRQSRMSFCEDGPADHVPLVNQEYCFEELVEEGGRGGEGGLGCVEGKGKESEEGEEGEGEGEEEDSDDVEKKITYHHEKRSWSTSSVESPMRTGITLKPNNRRSMGPPGGRGGGGGEGSNVIDWGAWEEGGGNNNCAVIGRENLDLLAWSAKAWNRRAEGRDSQRWGKKDSRIIIQKTQSLVTKEFGPQPLSLGSQDSCPGIYGAMWCCIRETMLVGNIPRSVKDFVGSVVGKVIASPFVGEGGEVGGREGEEEGKQLIGNEIEVEVEVGERMESVNLSTSSLEELFTLFVSQPKQPQQHLPHFPRMKPKASPHSPIRSPIRSNSTSYFSIGKPSSFSSSSPSPSQSPCKPLPSGNSSEFKRQKASTPPLPSPLSSAPIEKIGGRGWGGGGGGGGGGQQQIVFTSSTSSPIATSSFSPSFSSSFNSSSSSFNSSSNSLASSRPTLPEMENDASTSPKKPSKKDKKEGGNHLMSPTRKFRTHKKQKVAVANAQLSLSSLLLWSKAVTRGKGQSGFPKILHSPPYPPSLEPELLGVIVLNSYLCRIACLNFCGPRMERPLGKLTVAKHQRRGVPGESLEVFQGLGGGFEDDFVESGYTWDEEPLILTWARGSSRISRAFCRLLLEARREVDSFLSAAVIEFVEMRVNEFHGTTSHKHFNSLDWVDEEMRKFTEHSKSKDPFDLLCCQISLRTAYCPHLFQKKEKRELRKKFKDKQWVGMIAWVSALVSCRLASLAIKMRDENVYGYIL